MTKDKRLNSPFGVRLKRTSESVGRRERVTQRSEERWEDEGGRPLPKAKELAVD